MRAPNDVMAVMAILASLDQVLVQASSGLIAGLMVGVVALLLRDLLVQALTHQLGRGARTRKDAGS